MYVYIVSTLMYMCIVFLTLMYMCIVFAHIFVYNCVYIVLTRMHVYIVFTHMYAYTKNSANSLYKEFSKQEEFGRIRLRIRRILVSRILSRKNSEEFGEFKFQDTHLLHAST